MHRHFRLPCAAHRHACLAALAHALFLAFPCTLLLAAPAGPAAAQGAFANRAFDIPAGPLDQALIRFGAQARSTIISDPSLTAGLRSQGLHGQHGIEDGLRQLLAGTPLQAVRNPNGEGWRLRQRPASEVATLEAVTVRGALGPVTEGTGSYTTPVVSIMKGTEALKNIPQSVSVITRQRIEDQNLTTLEEVLDFAPGIYKVPGRGRIRDSDAFVYSRGYQIESYMVDGVTIQGDQGVSAASIIGTETAISGSSAIYDRMEVLRGAAGLLIGQGQPGGTVNLVRKRGTREFQHRYTASAGSWNSRHFQADIGGPLDASGNVRFRIVGDYAKSGRHWGYTPTKSEAPLIYGIVDFDVGPDTRLGISARHEEYREDAPPRATYQSDWGWSNSKDTEFIADLRHNFNDRWQLNMAARHREQDIDRLTTGVFFPDFAFRWAEVQSKMTKVKSDALDASLLGSFDALGQEQKLTLGFNVSNTELLIRRSELYSDSGHFAFDFDPATHDPSASWTDAYAHLPDFLSGVRDQRPEKTETRTYGVYGKLDLKPFDRLTVILGMRANWYDYKLVYGDYTKSWSGQPVGTVGLGSDKASALTPYAGLVFELTPQWSAYASYADIFRPQFGKYTRNGDVAKHVTGTNYELGLKGELANGALNVALAVFQIDEKNTTMAEDAPFDEVCPGNPTGRGCVVPLGHNRSRGFDAEISGELAAGWQLAAGYTYLDTKVVRADTGTGLEVLNWGVTSPKHLLKLWTSYSFQGGALRGLTVGGGGSITSRRELRDFSLYMPGYSVWDVFARYAINDHVAIALNLNNIFDKRYIYDADGYRYFSSNGTPRRQGPVNDSLYGPGRNFMLSLNATF